MPREVGSFLGEWWLPDKPERRVAGLLHITDRGELPLEPTRFFEEREPFDLTIEDTYPVVHGRAGKKEFTLLDVLPTTPYRPSTCLIGATLAPEHLKFNRICIAFPNLTRLTGSTGLSRTRTGDSPTHTWKRPPSRRTRISEGAYVDLSFSWESPSERDKLTIEETVYFDVQVDDPTEIESL